MLYCIADIYQEAIEQDDDKNYIQLDEHCYNFFRNKLKIKRLIKESCEKVIMSSLKYSSK